MRIKKNKDFKFVYLKLGDWGFGQIPITYFVIQIIFKKIFI